MHAMTPPNVIWVAARHDSAEYLCYEDMERRAHEASRAARPPSDFVRAPCASLGLQHMHDTAIINAQRPTTPGTGMYLLPGGDHVHPSVGAPRQAPAFHGWLSEGEALAWLDAFYPHVGDSARACMATCSGDRSLCACGVIDPIADTVRFYAVAARSSRRQKRKTRRDTSSFRH